MAYKLKNEPCYSCKGIYSILNTALILIMPVYILFSVHGFEKAFYNVTEGDNITIVFKKEVKGTSLFPSPHLGGIILSEVTDGRLGSVFIYSNALHHIILSLRLQPSVC